MTLRFVRGISVLVALLLVTGCVSVQPNINIEPTFWSNNNQTIGVALAKLPKPMSAKSGNQGLLDIMINDANASDLDKHLATLDLSSVNKLRDDIVEYLNKKNITAKTIDTPVDVESLPEIQNQQTVNGVHFAERDFSGLKEQYAVDKLLLVTVTRIGTLRSYYGFIPTSDPVGSSMINGKIINLSNNQLEWNQTASQNVPNAEGDWDSPPAFPGLTKAVYSSFEQSQQMLLNNFMQ